VERILSAMDNREVAQLAALDLSKAFDSVPHDLLLDKLERYGVRGVAGELFQSYLANRTQKVKWKEESSSLTQVDCGVPQGSVLGPVLFVVYLNDLVSTNESQYMYTLYADDTSILVTARTETETTEKMHTAVQQTSTWFRNNSLQVNENKTQTIIFTTCAEQVSSVKVLGLHLDGRLNWSKHIEQLCKRLETALYVINRMKRLTTNECTRLAYFSSFHSVATYGVLLWGSSSAAQSVFMLQKKALRILCNLQYTDSCREAFRNQGILTLPAEYVLACLKLIHTNKDNYPTHAENHAYPTRFGSNLQIPYHRINKTQQSASYWGIKFFNKLPEDLRQLPLKRFLHVTKRILVSMVPYTVEEALVGEWRVLT